MKIFKKFPMILVPVGDWPDLDPKNMHMKAGKILFIPATAVLIDMDDFKEETET